MKQTLERLWNGQIAPGANCGVNDREIEDVHILMERNREDLNRELGERQKAIFGKYVDCADEYCYLISAQAFCDGFCLASKLLTEALAEEV